MKCAVRLVGCALLAALASVRSIEYVLAGSAIPINTETRTCGIPNPVNEEDSDATNDPGNSMKAFQFSLSSATMDNGGSTVAGLVKQTESYASFCGSHPKCNHFSASPTVNNQVPSGTTPLRLVWKLSENDSPWIVDAWSSDAFEVKHHYGYTLKPEATAQGDPTPSPDSITHNITGIYTYTQNAGTEMTCQTHPSSSATNVTLTVYKTQGYKGTIPTFLDSARRFLGGAPSSVVNVNSTIPASASNQWPRTCLAKLTLDGREGPSSSHHLYYELRTIDVGGVEDIPLADLTSSNLSSQGSTPLFVEYKKLVADMTSEDVRFCPPTFIVAQALSRGSLVVRVSEIPNKILSPNESDSDTYIGIPTVVSLSWGIIDTLFVFVLLILIGIWRRWQQAASNKHVAVA